VPTQRLQQVLGMGLQGLEVTASSSKKVYPSPFVVLRALKLLGKVFRNSSRAGWSCR
jgi:hypothetical protein